MEEKLVKENQASHTQIIQQEKNTHILAQNQYAFKEHMNATKVQLRYLNDSINQIKRERSEEKQEKE